MATRYYSAKQETEVSRYLNGYLTPNSGATPFKKGDILLDDTIIECKTKTRPTVSFAVKKEWLLEVQKEAVQMGKPYWALIFDFGSQNIKDQYVVIPIQDFREYQELKRRELSK